MDHHYSEQQLYFKLLGTPLIFSYGEELLITRRNVRAMAYYLACQSGYINREDLKLLFWPDQSPQKASSALRETLSKLRGNLPQREMLVSTSTHIYFDQDMVQSDVRQFLELAQILESSLKNQTKTSILPAHVPPILIKAISLWDNGPLLNTSKLPATEDYDRWHQTFGSRLKLQLTNFITTLISHLVNNNNLIEAFKYLDMLNPDLYDDFNVSFHYDLLNSLLDAQNYTLAKTYLEYLRPISLNYGFNLEDTILKDVIETIKNPSSRPATESEKQWLQTFSFQLPFTGHDELIQKIDKLRNSQQGIILTGGAGVGKSRIAYELYQRLFSEFNFAHIEAYPSQGKEPYVLLRELILQLISREELQRLPISQRQRLTPIFHDITPDIPAYKTQLTLPPSELLTELGKGTSWLLSKITEESPTLIVIDNIQYCDFASFRIVKDLVEQGKFKKFGFLIVTTNPRQLSAAKKEKLANLVNHIQTVKIQPLSTTQTGILISQFLDQTIPSNLLEFISKETKGNIHLMLSSLNYLRDQIINEEAINQVIFTNAISLPSWYETQLQQLSKDTAALLDYCAILDSPLRHDILETATRWAPSKVNDALEELELHGFITPMSSNSIFSGYRFKHQMLNQQTIAHLTFARKRKIHFAIIEAFESLYKTSLDNVAATIVDHCFGAGDLPAAYQYTLKAAQFAIEAYAPEDANQLFSRMKTTMHENLHPFTDDQIMQFYAQWAKYDLMFNELKYAKIHAEQLLHQGNLRKSDYLTGTGFLYLGLAESAMQLGASDEAQFFDQAISYLTKIPPTLELIRCYVEKAYYYSTHNQQNNAYQICQEIINTVNPDPEREEEYQNILDRTKFTLAFLYAQNAELTKADTLLNEILGHFPSNIDPITAMHYRNIHVWVKFHLGQTENTQKSLQELLEYASLFNNELIKVELLTNLGRFSHHIGDNDAALNSADEGLEIASRYELHHLATNLHILKGIVFQSIGANEMSLEEFKMAKEEAVQDNHQLSLNATAIHLAVIEGYTGDIEKGFRMAKAVLNATSNSGNRFLLLQSQNYYHSLCIIKDPEHQYSHIGKEEIEFYIKECRDKGLALFEAYGETLMAHLEFNSGAKNLGFAYLLNAIKVSHSHGFKMFELSAYLLMAMQKELTQIDKIRVKTLCDEILDHNTDPRIANSTKEYIQLVAKTTKIA